MIELSDIIRLTKAQQKMVEALSSTQEALTFDQIAEAMGYNGDDPRKLVSVQLRNARKAIPNLPIEAVWGIGARWNG